jgi:hypothetical protein
MNGSRNRMWNMSRLVAIAVAGVIPAQVSLAADTNEEVRPSYLLNVETSGTMASNTAIVSIFGGTVRAAYGLTDRIELRADFGWNTVFRNETGSFVGVTAKANLWGNDTVGVGVLGNVSGARAPVAGASPVLAYTGRLPLTAKFSPVLFTVIPVISGTTTAGDDIVFGSDFGVAIPVVPWADVIGEFNVSSRASNVTTSYVAGVAFKPANRVTIPLVISTKDTANNYSLGMLGIFAHIGFEF